MSTNLLSAKQSQNSLPVSQGEFVITPERPVATPAARFPAVNRPHAPIDTPAGDIEGTRPTLARGDLVLTPDGFQARVVWLFTCCGDECAHVRRLGGFPGSFPVRCLKAVAQ